MAAPCERSGRLVGLNRLTAVNRDAARFHGLGQLTHEIDFQGPVLKGGACHVHKVGKVEHAPEGHCRNAPAQIGVVGRVNLAALNAKDILLGLDDHKLLAEKPAKASVIWYLSSPIRSML